MRPRPAIEPAGKKDKNSIKRVSPLSEMSQAHRSRGRAQHRFYYTAVLKIDRSQISSSGLITVTIIDIRSRSRILLQDYI